MLIEARTVPDALQEPALRWWRGARFTIGWKGHCVFGRREAGAATMAALAAALERRPLAELCGELLGVFGLFVWDRRTGTWQVACDNAGFYKIFHDEQRVGTDFLALAAARGARAAEIPAEAMLEFVAHGGLFGGRTFLPEVQELAAHEVLLLGPPAPGRPGLRRVKKRLDEPATVEPDFLLDHFDRLVPSLRPRRLSLDLTGGFDSRLLAALASHHGLVFEAATSGEPGSPDVAIARRAAAVLGVPLHVTRQHGLDRLEAELPRIFAEGGGLTDVYKFHRDRAVALARLARGIELFLHGAAGAIYKDFFVHHEFPFYHRTEPDLARFYRLRVAPVQLPAACLTPWGRELHRAIVARTLERFAVQRAATNHATYDRIAYFVRAPEDYGHQLSSYVNLGLDVVAPLAEHGNVVRGIRLSSWSRCMHGFHRRLITRLRPDLAALLTTDGYSASTALAHLPGDLLGYGRNELRRALDKASQRLIGRRLWGKAGDRQLNAPDFVDRLRATRQFEAALELFQARGILAPGLRPEQVREPHVGRMITVGMCVAAFDAAGGARAGAARRGVAVAASS
ncbi:asparagine synthase-related protein [Benzoatithermus flavus]|uniref:Asparagine synthase-related protein n=1 Tax=Benzoatithermus flavus TaxID=3108223 RepID=A0ABU8XXR8_9PROT